MDEFKNQQLGESPNGLRPAWVLCNCGNFYCMIHNMHTADCSCPEIDAWKYDPYTVGGESLREIQQYLNGLKEGDRVIETGESCMTSRRGTVYIKTDGNGVGFSCVKWDAADGETAQMGTSATWGTRRIADVLPGEAKA